MNGFFELEDDTAKTILKIDGEPVGTGYVNILYTTKLVNCLPLISQQISV